MSSAKIMEPGSAVAEPGETSRPPRLSLNWIVNAPTDLSCFIGGALGGYTLFAMNVFLGWDMLTIWVIWWVLLDVPHFFGTYMRTYLDREEMRRRPVLLWGSLGWLAVGPLLLLLCWAMYGSGSEVLGKNYQLPFQVLFVFVGLWAYWHVVRQHYGIMTLYKRKNNDHNPLDNRIDQILLYVGLLAPFVALIVRHREARWELGLPGQPEPWNWDYVVVLLTVVAVILAVALFVGRQVQRWQRGEQLNLAKILFLLSVVPLHLFVGYHPAVLTIQLIGFSAFVTIFHDFQYHAIVWHTERQRFRQPGANFQRFGVASLIGRHVLIYLACAGIWGLTGWVMSCVLGIQNAPGCGWLAQSWQGVPLFGEFTLTHVFFGLALGFIMHHYFVDQFIWRPSKDKNLRKELGLAQANG